MPRERVPARKTGGQVRLQIQARDVAEHGVRLQGSIRLFISYAKNICRKYSEGYLQNRINVNIIKVIKITFKIKRIIFFRRSERECAGRFINQRWNCD